MSNNIFHMPDGQMLTADQFRAHARERISEAKTTDNCISEANNLVHSFFSEDDAKFIYHEKADGVDIELQLERGLGDVDAAHIVAYELANVLLDRDVPHSRETVFL